MAVSTWFQNWAPPPYLYADNNAFAPSRLRNFSSQIEHNVTPKKYKDSNHPVTTFLPYLLTFDMLMPPYNKEHPTSNQQPNTRHFKSKTTISFDAGTNPYTSGTIPFNTDTADRFITETTGPFKTVYAWKQLDFQFPSEEERDRAILSEEFIQENNLPLGVEVHKNRMFVSMPKWKTGVPATLAVLPKIPRERSPKLVPYPSWEWHLSESCNSLTSVFRVKADTCNRLWVLDSGQIHVTTKPLQVCPPAVFIFDLKTDQLIRRYELPEEFIKQNSLYSNIIVDVRDNQCDNAHAYLTDVWRFGLVVYSIRRNKSWRVTDHLFYPDPLSAAYEVHGLKFEWTDGIFGMSLSPYSKIHDDRLLYFHPMSSNREFFVKTSVICNETGWEHVDDAFQVIGQSRGKSGQSSASGMDRNGVMFFNLVTRDSVGCWDSRKPYKRSNLGIVAEDSETMVFPNDLKIDNEDRQSVWVITNRLPIYLYKGLDIEDYNFRIMTAYVDEAIKGTLCDPKVATHDSFVPFNSYDDCY